MRSTLGVRRVALGALIAISLAVATACSAGSSADGGKATRGGQLVIARGEENKTLDPAAAVSPADIAPIDEIYSRLFELGDDGKTIVASLAAQVPTSPDGVTWTIALRPGVTFSDGTPVHAQDVKFSLDRSRKSDNGFSFLLSPIADVKAVNDQTVQITTTEPSATLLPALSSWVASIVPANFGGKDEKAFFTSPVGSGPFELDTWTRGQFISLKRNPDYWQKGKPVLDSVRWNTVPDANTRVSQVQSGQADAASDIPFNQLESLKSASGVTAKPFGFNYTSVLVFNQSYAPFADVHVRRAIAYAIDRDAVTKSALFGSGKAACSLVPPTMPYAADDACLPYDLSKAKSELAQSADPNGFSADLTIDNLPTSSTIAQIVQSQLEKLGIRLKIKVVDAGQLYTTLGSRAYQMGLAAWASDIPDPDEQLSFMLDPKAGGDSYYTGYDNANVTAMINQARASLDTTTRADLYAQVQQTVGQEVPQLAISYQDNPYVWRRTVRDFTVDPMGTIDLSDVGVSK